MIRFKPINLFTIWKLFSLSNLTFNYTDSFFKHE